MVGVGDGGLYKMYKSITFINFISWSKKMKLKMLSFWISWKEGTARTLKIFVHIGHVYYFSSYIRNFKRNTFFLKL
jgi:hypothetical protein